jgi:hypothetical protein
MTRCLSMTPLTDCLPRGVIRAVERPFDCDLDGNDVAFPIEPAEPRAIDDIEAITTPYQPGTEVQIPRGLTSGRGVSHFTIWFTLRVISVGLVLSEQVKGETHCYTLVAIEP